jgi:hypothetical protein
VREFAKKGVQHIRAVRNRKRLYPTHLKARIVVARDIPHEVEALWNTVEDGYSKIVVRNHAYLEWKYGSHPFAKYEAILVDRDKQLVGVGIFRHHGRESRLVDYVGPAEGMDIKASIVDTFMRACPAAESLNCICCDNEFKECLESAGFRTFRKKPSFGVFSRLPGDHDPERGWFVMAGDSDEDLSAGARDFTVD